MRPRRAQHAAERSRRRDASVGSDEREPFPDPRARHALARRDERCLNMRLQTWPGSRIRKHGAATSGLRERHGAGFAWWKCLCPLVYLTPGTALPTSPRGGNARRRRPARDGRDNENGAASQGWRATDKNPPLRSNTGHERYSLGFRVHHYFGVPRRIGARRQGFLMVLQRH